MPEDKKEAKWYWTTMEERYLRDNYSKLSTQKMANALGRKHSAVTMKMRRMGLQRQATSHPAQWKPGHTNSKSVDMFTVTTVARGEKFIKIIKTPDGWVPYARYVWEQANGKIPQDKKIWFVDGDQTNCELSNLTVVSAKEAMAFTRSKKNKQQQAK